MELFDLYTAEREKTGKTMVRGKPTPDGYYRLVVHVCLFDEEGRMLIQQRQPFKQGWSNLWDISVGGSAVAGDSSRSAAERETLEELGLAIDLSDVRPTLTIHWEKGFDDYYVLTLPVDLTALSLQAEEVQAVRWASLEEILQIFYRSGSIHPDNQAAAVDMQIILRDTYDRRISSEAAKFLPFFPAL